MMHTETNTTRLEQYIATHRDIVAVAVGTLFTVVLIAAWFLILAPLLSIGSVHMGMAVTSLAFLAGGIAAYAVYGGTE